MTPHPNRLLLSASDSGSGNISVTIDPIDWTVPHQTKLVMNGTAATLYLDGAVVATGTLLSPTTIPNAEANFSIDPAFTGGSFTVSQLDITQP